VWRISIVLAQGRWFNIVFEESNRKYPDKVAARSSALIKTNPEGNLGWRSS
jgi:hypothetical protein